VQVETDRPSTITVVNTKAEYAPTLEAMQRLCYPTLLEEERLVAAQYYKHLEVFPEGQFTAIDTANGNKPVGATSTLRVNFDFNHPKHEFMVMIDNGWIAGTHNPNGEWLYGADLMVHPDYWRRGIAKQLYTARFELVRKLGLRGQIAGGLIPGYYRYADKYSIAEYVQKVVADELQDPTLSAQLKVGFHYVATLYNYLHDESSHNGSALIAWDNPDYGR
jgi:GNAT superfamily N-acetyltransferase